MIRKRSRLVLGSVLACLALGAALLFLSALGGCQAFFEQVVALPGDAASGPEAGDAGARRCDPTAPFGAPQLVPGLPATPDAGGAAGARLTPDELTIYFLSSTAVTPGIFVATRASAADPFGPAVSVSVNALNDAGTFVDAPSPSSDDLTLFFGLVTIADGGGVTGSGIWRAQRSVRTQPFGPPAPVPFASTGAAGPDGGTFITDPFVTPDGTRVFCDVHAVTVRPAAAPVVDGQLGDLQEIPGFLGYELPLEIQGFVLLPAERESAFYFGALFADPYASKIHAEIWLATPTGPNHYAYAPLTSLQATGVSRVPTWISDDECDLYFEQYDDFSTSVSPSSPSVARYTTYVALRPRL